MTHIVNSNFTVGATQADGSVAVRETHTLSDGRTSTIDYFCSPDIDPSVVMSQRAARINAELVLSDALGALVSAGKINLTKLQFRRRFTLPERIAVDAFNASYEGNPMLTDEQKAAIRTNLKDYDEAFDIDLSDEGTIAGVQMYEALGLIAPGRAAEILNG